MQDADREALVMLTPEERAKLASLGKALTECIDALEKSCCISWGGFNLSGDRESIDEVVRLIHAADRADYLQQEVLELRQSHVADLGAATLDVVAERRRQVEEEGWTAEHDDRHNAAGELARAAACYALSWWDASLWWPWVGCWWKPSTRRRDLVKAGALILAEIDRLDRAAELARAREQ